VLSVGSVICSVLGEGQPSKSICFVSCLPWFWVRGLPDLLCTPVRTLHTLPPQQFSLFLLRTASSSYALVPLRSSVLPSTYHTALTNLKTGPFIQFGIEVIPVRLSSLCTDSPVSSRTASIVVGRIPMSSYLGTYQSHWFRDSIHLTLTSIPLCKFSVSLSQTTGIYKSKCPPPLTWKSEMRCAGRLGCKRQSVYSATYQGS
jgi:hypothetical protein